MNLQELEREREWRLCRGKSESIDDLVEGFEYFCRTYWKIRHPSRGRILFELYDAQLETVEAWLSHRYTVVLKARQIGFSTLASAYSFWLAYFWPDRMIVMLSKGEREAAKLLAKSKYGYKAMPAWMKQRGPAQTSDNQLKMTFSNESSIESLPSNNDPARGDTVYLVIVDELAFLPNSEEAWASIEPIADVGGRVIALSTAKGYGNLFHTLWVGSQTGTNDFYGIFHSWAASGRDDAWYAIKKRTLPDWQLHQEYPSNPEEAFLRSGNPVFDLDGLRKVPVVDPKRGYLLVLSKRNSRFEQAPEGEFALWATPVDTSVYVIGADVSEGLAHGDYSSAHVIDARLSRVVGHWHGHIEPDLFGHLLAEIGWMFGGALVGVESNNHGLTTLKALQNYGYPNIYRQRRLAQRRPDQTEILGWRTTPQSKPLAIDELAAQLRWRDEEPPPLRLPDSKTVAELMTFVRDDNGKMHGSPHDDRVMSLAIANQMLKYVWLPEYRPKIKAPAFSDPWFYRLAQGEDIETPTPIGAFNARNRY